MSSSEERLRILQMIQDGKISPAEGAKLLEALNRSGSATAASRLDTEGHYLRVRVTESQTGKSKVNVNLPLSLVDAGLSIASNFVPSVKNIDIMQAIRTGITGKIIDVTDDEDGEHVEIFIE